MQTLLIKLGFEDCPKGYERPAKAADWEGDTKLFRFPDRVPATDRPETGDRVYIWVHDTPRPPKQAGRGLTATASIQRGPDRDRFRLSDVQLIRPPVRMDELRGTGPFITNFRTFVHGQILPLSPTDEDEIREEIARKVALVSEAQRKLDAQSPGPAARASEPAAIRYREILEEAGFSVSRQTQKAAEFSHPALDTPVYLKVDPSGAPVSDAPLVIHPGLAALLAGQIRAGTGWQIQTPHYHMSNMTAFPRRVHTGQQETHYGSAVSCADEQGLKTFLGILLLPDRSSEEPADPDVLSLPPTERLTLTNARIGQGRYRYDLVELWKSCSVTDLSDPSVLIASHIKPWKHSDNPERLDCHNGLLLVPNLDRAFDRGLVSFEDDGSIVLSSRLPEATAAGLGIHRGMKLRTVHAGNLKYLAWHRTNHLQR